MEVDSFVFRRKRKALTPCQPPPPEPQQPAASPAAIKLGLQFESTSPAAGAARPAAAALQGDGKDSTTAEQEPVAAVGEPAEQDMLEPREAEQQVPPAAEHEAVADDLDMVPATQVWIAGQGTDSMQQWSRHHDHGCLMVTCMVVGC